MEQTKQKIRKISKFIKGGLIVVRVFIIIAIVFGGIIMLVPLVQPEEVEKIRHLFADNEIFLISFIVNIASDVPERYQMMIGGFILTGSMVALLIFTTKLGKLMDEMIHDDTPFNEAVSDRLRRYSWTMLILIVYNPLMALVAFLLMRLMYYIFEYGTFLQEKADETKRIQEEMIMSFAEITENKSEQTGKHVRRVAEYSKIIAKEMGLGNDEADRIRLASTMHDVGKLLIPAEILEKPARLTDEEFAEIKSIRAMAEIF
ncbi:MAG: HD domain-containing protein [Eubacterium sp.]|nr:HD domain-containing protein [Eubacterium sp.]